MTNETRLKYINYVCVKENSGGNLSPSQYNTLLEACNISMFNRRVQEAQVLSVQSKIPFNMALYEHAALREFHTKEDITFTAGVFDITTLTSDYAYFLSMIALYGGSYKEIEIVTDKELTSRKTNMLAPQLEDYPACEILGNNIYVYPNNITTAEFTFMKIPVKPVYDYYINAYKTRIYLAVGATHTLTSGETGSAGQTAGNTVTSLTVESEWNELWDIEFCNEILQRVAVNISDEKLKAYIREVEGKQL